MLGAAILNKISSDKGYSTTTGNQSRRSILQLREQLG